MSEIGLQKTFSRYAGVGVMEYFNNIKIRKSIELLKQGLSVKETALAMGYSDPNYFSTVFKRFTGHSPSWFKNNN
jgi:AraC-like DNA-binding protein